MSNQLNLRQLAVLQQMGVDVYREKQTRKALALICDASDSVLQTQLVQDVLLALDLQKEDCVESKGPCAATKSWFLGYQGIHSKTEIYSPSLPSSFSAEDKKALWKALELWL